MSGVLVSRFDHAKPVTSTQAVITARSWEGFTGGHASVYMEYLDANGEGQMRRSDMFYDEDTMDIVVRSWDVAHEYKPSNIFTKLLFSRSIVEDEPDKIQVSGQHQSYAVTADGIRRAMAKVTAIADQGARGDIKYSRTGNKVWNLNILSSVTYMNCADFAAEVLQAAGVSVSSGLFSMPSTVSVRDTRTHEQIYRDAHDMV